MIFQANVPSAANVTSHDQYELDLRQEFQFLCAYCLRHEFHFGGPEHGEIDHRKPKHRFPGGQLKYRNLFWSCHGCNQAKGTTWPDAAELKKGIRFIHPCKDDTSDHYVFYTNGEIQGKTEVGIFTMFHLKLWRESLVDYRRGYIEDCNTAEEIVRLLDTSKLPASEKQLLWERLESLIRVLKPKIIQKPMSKQQKRMSNKRQSGINGRVSF